MFPPLLCERSGMHESPIAARLSRGHAFRSFELPAFEMPARARILVLCAALMMTFSQQVLAADPDEIIIAFGAEPTQVDPTRTVAGVDAYFTSLFYEGLLTVTPDQEQVNWLAESWDVVTDGDRTRIRIRIRKGVKFHNGDELTSRDFEYAWQRQSDPASRIRGQLRYVERIDIHDDYSFDIVLTETDGSFEPQNLILSAIPSRYFQEVGEAGLQAHPIGTGPWKFVSRKPREELIVERFEDYWNKDYMPGVKRLVIRIIPEDTTRVAAFRTGAVDWIDAVPPALVSRFRQMPGVHVVSLPTPNNLYLEMNAVDQASPFRKLEVRQAVAHAIDFDAIIQYILYGQGIRTPQLAPGESGYDPDLAAYSYDPDRARELLTEAGFAAGIRTNCYNLTTPREPYIKEVGETMFAYLAEVGIRCRIIQLEYGTWLSAGRRDTRPLMDGLMSAMWGHGLPGDPTIAWSGHVHTANDGWGRTSYSSDSEVDELVRDLRRTMDKARRIELIKAIARLKNDRVLGGLPTYRPLVTLAWRDTINFRPWPGAFWRSMREIGHAPEEQVPVNETAVSR